jgi:hypothetical protein
MVYFGSVIVNTAHKDDGGGDDDNGGNNNNNNNIMSVMRAACPILLFSLN